jgi:hypothetical protein
MEQSPTGEPVELLPVPAGSKAVMESFIGGMAHERAPQLRDLGFSTRWTVFSNDGSVIQRSEKRHHLALSAYMRGLLLQHYGAPTAWLDITRDSTVALCFAFQTMKKTPDGVRVSAHTWAARI